MKYLASIICALFAFTLSATPSCSAEPTSAKQKVSPVHAQKAKTKAKKSAKKSTPPKAITVIVPITSGASASSHDQVASPELAIPERAPTVLPEPMKPEIPATVTGPTDIATAVPTAPPEPLIARSADCQIQTCKLGNPTEIAQPQATAPPKPVNPYLAEVPVARDPSQPSGNPYLPGTVAVVTFVNPYLQPVIITSTPPPGFFPVLVTPPTDWRPGATTPLTALQQPVAILANPLADLKTKVLGFLPDDIGHMRSPIFVELVDQGSGERKLLLVQVLCPTKALLGFDTPPVMLLQLGVDQIIALANATVSPVEIQKVCR